MNKKNMDTTIGTTPATIAEYSCFKLANAAGGRQWIMARLSETTPTTILDIPFRRARTISLQRRIYPRRTITVSLSKNCEKFKMFCYENVSFCDSFLETHLFFGISE